jgi:hypothetical protein
VAAAVPPAGDEGVLDTFSRMLYAVTHYSKLQPLAYVPSSGNAGGAGSGGAQILSSVDFDCAGQLFAAAGGYHNNSGMVLPPLSCAVSCGLR